MHMTQVFKTFDFWPNNLMSSTMIDIFLYIHETTFSFQLYDCKINILKAEEGFLDGVYIEVQITIIIVTKIKKGFLKKKERLKGFFIIITMLSFKQVESNYGKKEHYKQAISQVIKFSHCLNFRQQKYTEIWLCFFIGTHKKKKIYEMNNF